MCCLFNLEPRKEDNEATALKKMASFASSEDLFAGQSGQFQNSRHVECFISFSIRTHVSTLQSKGKAKIISSFSIQTHVTIKT